MTSKTKAKRKPAKELPEPRIECELKEPAGWGEKKKRQFLLLAQAMKDGKLHRQAAFSTLDKAQSWIECREVAESYTCSLYAIECDPAIATTMTWHVRVVGETKAETRAVAKAA